MSNFSIKVNLLGLKNAGICTINGKTGPKKCIVIPIEDNDIYVGEKGSYLSLSAIQMQNPKYEETHIVKHSLSSEKYKALSEEERSAIPIIGGLRPLVAKGQNVADISAPAVDIVADEDNDLPF